MRLLSCRPGHVYETSSVKACKYRNFVYFSLIFQFIRYVVSWCFNVGPVLKNNLLKLHWTMFCVSSLASEQKYLFLHDLNLIYLAL